MIFHKTSSSTLFVKSAMNEIAQLLRATARRLAKVSNDGQTEAEIILSTLLGVNRQELYAREQAEIPPEQLDEIIKRRLAREPLQYILGEAYFMNLTLEVAPGVLIPRPETELLVEWVCQNAPQGARICDLGTGSGAIALAVAAERPDVKVTAFEISPAAAETAERNRKRYQLDNVAIVISDLLATATGRFDVIAANLPYISDNEYETLQPEVKNHEPRIALTSGPDGLDLIRRAVAAAPNYLKSGGFLILELGASQAAAVLPLLKHFEDCKIIKDYNNQNRHIHAKLRGIQ